ncbi:MAG: single-stranded-DNA-specific exonuclease RecJ [Candidatus Margulisbacteria bacterium]|jgi:single-stranded-DNA-specific exonuclease|nr:single-stranded-DNA-specific exonuclease RecJ [Candidatus Margulisiibacteriota bacterium]
MKKWLIDLPADPGSPLLERILSSRGIITPAEREAFLNPKLGQLRDPLEIPQIEAAARRVLLAKEKGEKVAVFGDYDVDGVTATAILLSTLRYLGFSPTYYIPKRYGEGYSLSTNSVKKLASEGVKLIITVDCGIASADEIVLAGELGMTVVVTDHHNLPEQLPPAAAIVNPKMIKGPHPSKYLSGAGVAFKLAWVLLRLSGEKDGVFLTSLLDLAALGTFSDVVPLTAENRILAVGGLRLINERKRLGIKLLAEAASLGKTIGADRVYFALAPRLNAAGRLEHASKAVELLLTDDPLKGQAMAQELNKINTRRQDIGAVIKDEVFSQLTDEYLAAHRLIVLAGENWHPGVIGIVASQIVDRYGKPAVLIGINEGVGRGSARSVDGFNIYALLDSCRDLFLDFGGHEGAAGFEIEPAQVPELQRRLRAHLEENVDPESMIPKLELDAQIDPQEISLALVKELNKLAPFGEGNQAPLLLIGNLSLLEHKTVGKDKKHLKAWFGDNGLRLETIGFGFGALAAKLDYNQRYDLAVNLEANEYNGFESVQLSLVDIREAAA